MVGYLHVKVFVTSVKKKKTLLVSFTQKHVGTYVCVRITTISNRGTELLKISNIALDFVVLIFFMIDFDIAQNYIFFNLKVIYK